MRALFLVCLVACGGPQHATEHVADLTKALPSTLEAARPKEGEPRTVKVRVWVDAAVRADAKWRDEISDQIDYASQLLTPLLGVRITLDTFKDWDRKGEPSKALDELVAADNAQGVTWVIGYIGNSNEGKASKAMTECGAAQVLGHHVIVRAWMPKPEADALADVLLDLKQRDRPDVLAAHKRHKQTVVLLHMLAATLGAIGEADPAWIQSPLYSPKQSTFSERNRELMQLAIDRRIEDVKDADIAHELIENIEKSEWGGWIASDKDEVTALLRAAVDAAKSGKTAADVPVAALDQFARIRDLRRQGKLADARAELDNLLSAYPGNPSMHQLRCELFLQMARDAKSGIDNKTARAACTKASELAPGDPSPHIAVADVLVASGDLKGAHVELEAAAKKIANLPKGADLAWKKLVHTYQAMGALTWAEQALAAGKLDNDPAAAQIAQVRARYGVPRGAKVKPEDEGALVLAVRGALDLVYKKKYGDAEKAIAAGEKKWPGTAGFSAVRCDMYFAQGLVDAARNACEKALAADPNESWALYLGGVIALRDTSAAGTKAGIDKLKAAIAADPELGQAWRTLGKAYIRAKDKAAFDALDEQYAAKFGQRLPQ